MAILNASNSEFFIFDHHARNCNGMPGINATTFTVIFKSADKTTKKTFPLVVTFNPRLPNIGQILRKHVHVINSHPKLKECFPANFIIPPSIDLGICRQLQPSM